MLKSKALTPIKKRYIVRHYIMATSAAEALRLAKQTKPDECWLDDKWVEEQTKQNPSAIGFILNRYDDWLRNLRLHHGTNR